MSSTTPSTVSTKDDSLAVNPSRQFLSPDVGYGYPHHGHHHHHGGGPGGGGGGQSNLERVPSMTRLQPQSSTETSGLGETVTSGFSSQESVHSAANYSYSPTRFSPGKASPTPASPEVSVTISSFPNRAGYKLAENPEHYSSKTRADVNVQQNSSSYNPSATARYANSDNPADYQYSSKHRSNPYPPSESHIEIPARRNPSEKPPHYKSNQSDSPNYISAGAQTISAVPKHRDTGGRSLSPDEARALFVTRSTSIPAARGQHSAVTARHARERALQDGGFAGERRGGGPPSRDVSASRQAGKSSGGVVVGDSGRETDTPERSTKRDERHSRAQDGTDVEKRSKLGGRAGQDLDSVKGASHSGTEPSLRRGDIDRRARHASSDSQRQTGNKEQEEKKDAPPGKNNIYTPDRHQPTSVTDRTRKDSNGRDRYSDKNYSDRQTFLDREVCDKNYTKEHSGASIASFSERGRQRSFDEKLDSVRGTPHSDEKFDSVRGTPYSGNLDSLRGTPYSGTHEKGADRLREKRKAQASPVGEDDFTISRGERLAHSSVQEGREVVPRKEREASHASRHDPDHQGTSYRNRDLHVRDEIYDRRFLSKTGSDIQTEIEYTASDRRSSRNVARQESRDSSGVERRLEKQRSRDSGIERTLDRKKPRENSSSERHLERQQSHDSSVTERTRSLGRQQSRDSSGREQSLETEISCDLNRQPASHLADRLQKPFPKQLSRDTPIDLPYSRDFPGSHDTRKRLGGYRDKVVIGHRVNNQLVYSGEIVERKDEKKLISDVPGSDTHCSPEQTHQQFSGDRTTQKHISSEEQTQVRHRHHSTGSTKEKHSGNVLPEPRKHFAKSAGRAVKNISEHNLEKQIRDTDGARRHLNKERKSVESYERLRRERKESGAINNVRESRKSAVASPPSATRVIIESANRQGETEDASSTLARTPTRGERDRRAAGTSTAPESFDGTRFKSGAKESAQERTARVSSQPHQFEIDSYLRSGDKESFPNAESCRRELPSIARSQGKDGEVISTVLRVDAVKGNARSHDATHDLKKTGIQRPGNPERKHIRNYTEFQVAQNRSQKEFGREETGRGRAVVDSTDSGRRRNREKGEDIELHITLDGRRPDHATTTLSSTTRPATMGSDGRKPPRQPPPTTIVTVTSPTSPESNFRPRPDGDLTSRRREPERGPQNNQRHPVDGDVFENLFSQSGGGRGPGPGGGGVQVPGLQVNQINHEWERRSSRGSLRSRSSHGGSFRSRSGSTRRKGKGRFLGVSTESAWTRWSRDRRASFRRRIELLEKPEETNQRVSTPVRKARQEGLKFVHPDLEGTFLSEEDLNELRRHKQQKYHAIRVIEKTNRKGKFGIKHEVHLTSEQWQVIGDFWEHPAFVRGRYLGLILMFVTFIIMVVSITNGNWVLYEAWNLTTYEGLWVNCSTPILVPGDEVCKPTNGREWQNAVIGLMIFAAFFGILASVLSICGVCTSPLPRKIYYFHSAGEIFLICALSTGVALMVYPIAIELDRNISSHRYGIGYGLGWGGAFFFLAAAVCMSLDDLVREASRAKCCRWCWKSTHNDRTELRQV